MPATTSTLTRRLDWVDAAKGISIILVVLGHTALETSRIGANSAHTDWVIELFSTLRMPLFFAASALFVTKYVNGSWRQMLDKKLALLIWVFAIWQGLAFLRAELATVLFGGEASGALAIAAKYALSPFRPVGEVWFLWALAVFLVVAKLTRNWPVWAKLGIPGIIALAWPAVAAAAPITEELGPGWNGAASYYVFYAAALHYREAIVNVFGTLRKRDAASIISAWAIVSAVTIAFGVNGFLTFPIGILGVAAGFSIAVLLQRSSTLVWLGKHTLPVFVLHIGVLTLLVACVQGLPLPVLPLQLALWIAAIIVPLGIYQAAGRLPGGQYLFRQPPQFLAARRHGSGTPTSSSQAPTGSTGTHVDTLR